MKKIIIILLVAVLLFMFFPIDAYGEDCDNPYGNPVIVEMTYYTETDNPCANGKHPRDGIVAFSPKYIGYAAILYENNNGKIGDLIGIYEIYDTGYGRKTSRFNELKNRTFGTIELGVTVDVFKTSDATGVDFIKEHGNSCFIQVVKADG